MKWGLDFKGMGVFSWLWLGQLFSSFGTVMTRFAVTIWAYQQTGEVTTLALMGFFNSGAFVLASPLAGVLVDRWDRKRVMILADLGAGMVTAGLLALYLAGRLQIWHLYLGGVLSNALGAFQEPAFNASVSLIVPQAQLTRANAMLAMTGDGSRMFAPILAGMLLLWVKVGGIMVIDILTCLIAVAIVVLVHIPRPVQSMEGKAAPREFKRAVGFGFQYIAKRPGLLGILLIFTMINLFAAVTYYGVLAAMILARSGNDQIALGTVQSMLGVGAVVGGLLLSAWGGPKKRVNGFLGATAISFLLGDFLFAAGRSLPVWAVAAFCSSIFIPFIVSCYEAIWQTSVPPDIQGRVFSAKNVIQIGSMPLGYLAAGFLADAVFEPSMAVGGSLSGVFGWLVGIGPGAGMGLMFACTCVLGMLTGLSGFLFPVVRDVERAR